MITYTANSVDVARFVADILLSLNPASVSITITVRGASEGCSVSIVTDTSSEDIVKTKALIYFKQLTTTSQESTSDG